MVFLSYCFLYRYLICAIFHRLILYFYDLNIWIYCNCKFACHPLKYQMLKIFSVSQILDSRLLFLRLSVHMPALLSFAFLACCQLASLLVLAQSTIRCSLNSDPSSKPSMQPTMRLALQPFWRPTSQPRRSPTSNPTYQLLRLPR